MVVDEQTVENSFTATAGDNDHMVDTPGKVIFNGAELDFTASNSIEITSLGENVAFQGSSLLFHADEDIFIEGIDTSIISDGDITGTVGGMLSTHGTDAEIRSTSDATYVGDTISFSSPDTIEFDTDSFALISNSVLLNSEESNLFIDSLITASFIATETISIIADSGIEIGSSHGSASFNVEEDIVVLSENFIYTTETNSFFINDTLSLESNSIAGDIFMYTERGYVNNLNGDITLESTGTNAQTAFLSTGTIESMSNTFSSNADTILILSTDGTQITGRTDIDISATQDMTYLASGGMIYGGNNVILESTNSTLDLNAFGKIYFSSISADILMNVADEFTFTTGSTYISADNTMQLNSDNLDITSSFMDFYSFRDIVVNTDNLNVISNNAIFDSHEETLIRMDSTSFTASDTISSSSTGTITFRNSVDFIQNVGNDINYISTLEEILSFFDTTVNADIISIVTGDIYHHFSQGSIDFNATTSFTVNAEQYNVIADNNIDINAENDISFNSASVGGFNFETFHYEVDADNFIIDSDGNVVFTANTITTDASTLSLTNQDLLISSAMDINVQGETSLTFTAPSTFVYLPGSITSTRGDFMGLYGVHFGAGFELTDSLSFTIGDSLIDSHNDVYISGGSVAIGASDIILGTSNPQEQDVLFTVAGEKDLLMDIFDVINFSAGDDITLSSSNLLFQNDPTGLDISFFIGDDTFISIDEEFSIQVSNDITISSNIDFSISNYGKISINAEEELIITGNNLATFNADTLLDIVASDTITFDSNDDINSLSRNLHLYADTWSTTASDLINISVGEDAGMYFDNIIMNMGDTLSITADRFETNSVTETEFNSQDDITVTSSTISIQGGSISVTGTNDFDINTTTNIVIGSNDPTPLEPNLYDVNFEIGGSMDLTVGGELIFIATSNEEFEELGISIEVNDFNVQSTNQIINAYKGALVNTPAFATTSGLLTSMTAQEGALFAFAERTGGFIAFNTEFSGIFDSDQAAMILQAGDDISSTSGSLQLTAGKEINMETLTNNDGAASVIEFESVNLMSFTGNALTMQAGLDEQTIADIDYRITGSTTINFGTDVSVRALGNEESGQSNEQIQLNGGTNGDPAGYTVTAGQQLSFYPSGPYSIDVALDGLFTGTEKISYGSASNEFSLRAIDGPIEFNSGRDFSAKAGGVSGYIEGDIGDDFTITVSGNTAGSSNGTTLIESGNIILTTATDISFFTNNDMGNINIQSDDTDFSTIASPTLSTMDFIGKNIRSYSSDLDMNSPFINFGQINQLTPRITAEVELWDVSSVGDVSFNAENDKISHFSNDFDVSGDSILLQSQGDILFETLDDIQMIITTQLTMTASDFIETDVGDLGGSITHSDITFSSLGKNTGNGIYMNTNNNINFISDDLTFDIITSYTLNTQSGDITANTLTSTSQTLEFNMDNELSFISNNDMTINTLGNSAKIETIAEGINGDIEFGVTTLDITSGDDILILSSVFEGHFSGDISMSTSGASSGKIIMDASNNGLFRSDGDMTLTGQDDFSFEATGNNSLFDINAGDSFIFNTDRSMTFETDQTDGGSIFLLSEDQPTVTFTTTDWTVDIDGTFNVDTLGDFNFISTVGDFELAADGFGRIVADDMITITSAGGGSSAFTSNTSRVIAADTATILSGDITNMLFGDSLDITVIGNDTSSTSSTLTFDGTQAITFTTNTGDLGISAYNVLHADSEYMSFVASGSSGNTINIGTSHAGGDFVADTITADIIGNNILLNATGNDYESGFIKLIADKDGYYDPAYWISNPDIDEPSVTISSGTDTNIVSLTGSIRTEFASKLLLTGGEINTVAGTSINFHVRGDGRLLQNIYDIDDDPISSIEGSIVLKDISGAQFLTESFGDILVQSKAADVLVDSDIAVIRSDIEDLYLEASGTVAILSVRSTPFIGIEFISTGDINLQTFDDDITMLSEFMYITTPNVNGIIDISTDSNSLLNFVATDIILFDCVDMLITTDNSGPINLETTGGDIIFNAGATITIDASELFFAYHNDLEFDFLLMDIETNDEFPDNDYTYRDSENIVRFEGRRRDLTTLVDNRYSPDVSGSQSDARSSVQFPTSIQYLHVNTFDRVSQGTWCEYNRQIGYGETNQGGQGTYTDQVFCVCVDHVWACVYENPFSNYFYDIYNVRPNPP